MNVKVTPFYRKTLQQAVHDAGGVANLLYLFAKVMLWINIPLPGESKKFPAFERLLLPEYISNDILQYLIK